MEQDNSAPTSSRKRRLPSQESSFGANLRKAVKKNEGFGFTPKIPGEKVVFAKVENPTLVDVTILADGALADGRENATIVSASPTIVQKEHPIQILNIAGKQRFFSSETIYIADEAETVPVAEQQEDEVITFLQSLYNM